MKLLFTLLGLLCAFGLRAANPSFTDLVQTNVLWVAKNGNNSTAKPGNPALKYLTISNAVQAAVKPAVVKVAPGVYNESIILRDGVNLEMPSGVIVSQSVNGLSVLFDNGAAVTNFITGNPIIKHAGSGQASSGLRLSGDSDVSIETVLISSLGGGVTTPSGSAIPKLRFRGKVYAKESSVSCNAGSLNFVGEAYGTNDYGIIVSDSKDGVSNYISGFVFSLFNSAIHIGGAFCLVENATAVSFDTTFGWGLECSGGAGEVRNSKLVSANQEAIGKYGGDLLVLDGVQLFSTNNLFSIDNDGDNTHGSIQIRGTCWANRPVNPAMNITEGGVTITNSYEFKQPQIFRSVHGLTNIVARTNGNTWFPTGAASYSTLTTNAIGATGYTNNQEITQTAYVTATAVAFTVKDRAQATLYVSPVITATLPVTLQPGWSITAASGLVGTVLPW